MGFFDIFKPKTDILPFEHFSGIKFVNQKEIIALNFLEDCLLIEKSNKQELLKINYSDIENAEVMTEVEENDKNVIGRAIVGGLVLGSVGALVGGISGTTKSKKKNYFLKITYKENEEIKEIYLKGAFNSENICNIAQKQIAGKCQNEQ